MLVELGFLVSDQGLDPVSEGDQVLDQVPEGDQVSDQGDQGSDPVAAATAEHLVEVEWANPVPDQGDQGAEGEAAALAAVAVAEHLERAERAGMAVVVVEVERAAIPAANHRSAAATLLRRNPCDYTIPACIQLRKHEFRTSWT